MIDYSGILEHRLLPLYDSLRGRRYTERRSFLEESQWWPAARLAEFQWSELQRLVRHCFASVPFYRRKFAAAGAAAEDIRSLADYARLPALTREEVNACREEMRSLAYRGKLLPHATGGSSGTPTRFYITPESYDWRTAAAARAYSWSGHRAGEPTLYLWGAATGKVSHILAWKKRLYHGLRRETVFSTFQQTPELWARVLRSARRFRPRYVVGYVSSVENFAKYLLAEGAALEGVRAVIAAAEPVFASARQTIERAFAAPLFNTYGSREFMSIAGECDRHRGMHVNVENILLEAETPGAGEASELLVTDLHNYGMPFLRYRIGDLGTLAARPCPCGRGLPLLEQVEGRVLDAMRTRDGRVVPGEFFPHLMKDVPEAREFQAEQKTLDEVVVSVVLSAPLSAPSREFLRREIAKVFGGGVRVSIEPVDRIPLRPSGKRRVTIGLPQPR